jgi:ectoine hydroxylase-related dioxygenase (phytanoyl-CoA dioxygenase family)
MVANLLEFDPLLFLPLAAHPELLDFAEQVMGPTVQLDSMAFNVFPNVAQEKATGVVNGWHRDRYAEIPEGTDYIIPNGVNAIVYLQDLTAASGPLRVIPARTDSRFTCRRRNAVCRTRMSCCSTRGRGDVVFTHGSIVHSGTPNTSGGPRYFLSAFYNRCWMRHRDNHSGPRVEALIEDARARGDLRLLRLLGIDAKRWDRAILTSKPGLRRAAGPPGRRRTARSSDAAGFG